MTTVTVKETHEAADSSTVKLLPGEVVIVGERGPDDDGMWPAFIPVTAANGESGWVPSRYISEERPEAVVCEEYDTTELPAAAGDQVELLVNDEESGWSWVRNADGAEGWIPNDCLELV